jgi:hypothetical protein
MVLTALTPLWRGTYALPTRGAEDCNVDFAFSTKAAQVN